MFEFLPSAHAGKVMFSSYLCVSVRVTFEWVDIETSIWCVVVDFDHKKDKSEYQQAHQINIKAKVEMVVSHLDSM